MEKLLNNNSYHRSNIKWYYYITTSNRFNHTKIAENKRKGRQQDVYNELKYVYRVLYIKI